MGNQAPPLKLGAAVIALDERVFQTATVAASPTAGTETIIASLTLAADLVVTEGVLIFGYAAYTVGTDGVSGNLRIRRTDASGTIVKASGALTVVAAELHAPSIVAFDTGPTLPNQVYVLTLTVGSASAGSTVSAVTLAALVV